MLWLLALGVAAFCVYAVVQFVRYRGSDNWPTTLATVENIQVRRVQDGDGHHFHPVVSFSFLVSQEYYSGEWVGPAFSTEQETRNFMQQNTLMGSKLSAQYKPDNPKLNLLDIDPALWDKGRPSHSVSEEGSWNCGQHCPKCGKNLRRDSRLSGKSVTGKHDFRFSPLPEGTVKEL